MTDALAGALERMTEVAEGLLQDRRRAAMEAHWEAPEARAEREAKRRPLRKMPFGAFVRSIPDIAEAFVTKVPGNFWAYNEGLVTVPCPCKGATVYPRQWPAPCPAAESTGCPRWYLFDGEDVRVAFSPVGGAPSPQDEDQPMVE